MPPTSIASSSAGSRRACRRSESKGCTSSWVSRGIQSCRPTPWTSRSSRTCITRSRIPTSFSTACGRPSPRVPGWGSSIWRSRLSVTAPRPRCFAANWLPSAIASSTSRPSLPPTAISPSSRRPRASRPPKPSSPARSRSAAGFLDLPPGVAQPDRAIEDGASRPGVARVHAEVAGPLELDQVAGAGRREGGLDLAVGKHGERLRVQRGAEILRVVRLGLGEQRVVESHLGPSGVGGGDPVDGALHVAAFAVASEGFGIVLAAHLDDLPRRVLLEVRALDDVGVAEAHLGAGGEAEVLLGRHLAEVVLLDPQLAAEGDLARARRGVLGIVHRVHLLHLALGIVLHDELEGTEHGHAPLRAPVEVLAEAGLEEGQLHRVVVLGHPDALAEVADGLRGVAAPA